MTQQRDLTLLAVGDVMISRPDPVSIFDGVRPMMESADLIFANLEGACTDRGVPCAGKREVGSVHQRAPVNSVPAYAEIGSWGLSLANNHMMDYGEEGLVQTMDLLAEHGLAHTGAGSTYDEARRAVFMERGGTKIALLGYTCVYPQAGYEAKADQAGVATAKVHTAYQPPHNAFYQPGTPAVTVTTPDAAETTAFLADVRAAREQADIVVVQMHWGVAGLPRNLGYMKELGRAAIDAGAAMIVGAHPHIFLGVELYGGGVIAYSLSHFAFDGSYNFKPGSTPPGRPGFTDSLALTATVRDNRFQRLAITPVVLDPETKSVQVADEERREAVRASLEQLSHEFGTTFTPEGRELLLGGPAPGSPSSKRAPEVLADPVFSWSPAMGASVGPNPVKPIM